MVSGLRNPKHIFRECVNFPFGRIRISLHGIFRLPFFRNPEFLWIDEITIGKIDNGKITIGETANFFINVGLIPGLSYLIDTKPFFLYTIRISTFGVSNSETIFLYTHGLAVIAFLKFEETELFPLYIWGTY